MEAVTDFIPRLLSNIHVECLVYGNCSPDHARALYTGVVDKLTSDCKSRPLMPSQLMKEREVELRNQHSIYTMTNSVHRLGESHNFTVLSEFCKIPGPVVLRITISVVCKTQDRTCCWSCLVRLSTRTATTS